MSAVAPAKAAAPAGTGGAGQRRPRIVALDLIRLLVIGFVVSVHTLANGGTVTVPLGAFITVFHTSRELFFLLTAFVLVYNYGHRPRVRWLGFWWRRYLLVVPAYVAWTLIYFLADGWHLHPVPAALHTLGHDLLTGSARYHLYFLLVTMQVYLVFPLVRWLLRRTEGHHLAVFVVACGYQLALTLAIQHHLGGTWPVVGAWLRNPSPWLPSYVLYLVGGGLAAWHFERLAAFTRRHTRAAMIVMAAGVVAGVGTYYASVFIGHESAPVASAVFQPVVIVETLAYGWGLLAVGLRWADTGARHRRLLAAGADCSFGIYLAHPLVLQGLILLASTTGALSVIRHAPAPAELAVLLGIGLPVVYAVSWAVAFCLRRTPLSLVLTGRR